MKIIMTVLLALSLSPAFASAKEEGPCRQIRSACEAAGFTKGGHKTGNKGLFVDCLKKIEAGETVPGVSVTADQVSACKAKKTARAEKKAAKASAAPAAKTGA